MLKNAVQTHEVFSFSRSDLSWLVVTAGGETHLIRYAEGHEIALLSCLMDYAADPRYKIGWPEVLSVIRRLGL